MSRAIERQRHIIDFTLSSLLRRKGKNGALLAVYTLIVFLLASIMFFTYALKREAELVLRDTPEIVVQRTLTGRNQPVPVTYADKIRGIRGVISARPRLWGYYYDANFLANYTLVVPRENPPPPGTIVIGSGISRMREAYPGDTMGFTGFDGAPLGFTVASVISPES
ncbi:MAG TPA: ABC transporter permease, partial [Geobacteraceae bacterium]